jgi:hypothetical protein
LKVGILHVVAGIDAIYGGLDAARPRWRGGTSPPQRMRSEASGCGTVSWGAAPGAKP